jgi:hypothetical protein
MTGGTVSAVTMKAITKALISAATVRSDIAPHVLMPDAHNS